MSDCRVPMAVPERPAVKEVTCYECPVCHKVYWKAENAEGCCLGHRCPDCGGEIENWSKRCCNKCWDERIARKDRERWEAAKHVKLSEYQGEMLYYNEEYYNDEIELIEAVVNGEWECRGAPADDIPPESAYKYPDAFPKTGVYGTTRNMIGLSADMIIDMLAEDPNVYEDYEVEGLAERDIRYFVEDWNERHADYSYGPDYSIGIVADGGDDE